MKANLVGSVRRVIGFGLATLASITASLFGDPVAAKCDAIVDFCSSSGGHCSGVVRVTAADPGGNQI
jgi:hypothetical protein